MSRALPFAVAALLSCGCVSTYLTATGQFAQAAREGAGSLSSAFDLSSQICRDRADLAYLLPRMKAPLGADAIGFAGEPMRSPWYGAKSAGPGDKISWADHCDAIAAADGVHRNALQVVIGYGWALQGGGRQETIARAGSA